MSKRCYYMENNPFQDYFEQAMNSQVPEVKVRHLTQAIGTWTEDINQGYLALAHYYRAEAYNQQKQFNEVIPDIDEVIRLLPADKADHPLKLPDGSSGRLLLAKSYYLLGLAHFEKKEYFLAIKAYTKAVALEPTYWEAYFERAIAHEFNRSYRYAIYDYNTVLELNPQCALAYYNRGTMHFQLHEHEQAAADYAQAIKLDPQDALAHFNLGVVYGRLDRLKGGYAQKAIECYAKVIELDPKNSEAYYNRGHLYMIKKHYDDQLAIADFQKAAELGDQKAKNILKRKFGDG
jgi:tetratricopeptide (TPR) repeat protein